MFYKRKCISSCNFFSALCIFSEVIFVNICGILGGPYLQGWCWTISILKVMQPSNLSLNLTFWESGPHLTVGGRMHFWDWGLRGELWFALSFLHSQKCASFSLHLFYTERRVGEHLIQPSKVRCILWPWGEGILTYRIPLDLVKNASQVFLPGNLSAVKRSCDGP